MQGTRLVALALPVTLVLGFAIGYVVGGSAPEPAASDTATVSRREAPAARPTADAAPRPVAPSAPLPATGSDGGTEISDEARRLAAAATRRAEASIGAAAVGTETLRGTVFDGAGAALAGATVVVRVVPGMDLRRGRARDSSKLGLGWDEVDRGGFTAQAESYLRMKRSQRVVATGADGRFEIDGLPEHSLSVVSYLEGYTTQPTIVEPGPEVTITMTRVGEFHIEPRLPDGSIATDAIVTLNDGSRFPDSYRWTADAPVVKLRATTARIEVLAGEMVGAGRGETVAEYSSEVRTIDLEQDGDGPHVFELRARSALVVSVERPRSELGNIPLRVTALRSGETEATTLVGGGQDNYVLADIPPGEYVVSAGRRSDPAPKTKTVQVPEGWTETSITLDEIDSSAFLVVRVLDHNGRPVPGPRFRRTVEYASGRRSSGSVRGQQRPGGETWLPWAEFEAEGDDEIRTRTLEATAPMLGSISQELTGPDQPVLLQFEEPATCTVQVTGDIGSNLQVTLAPDRANVDPIFGSISGRSQSTENVPAGGEVDMGVVQPGDYVLSIRRNEPLEGGAYRPGESLTESVTLGPGPNSLTIAAPVEHDLIVTVPGDDERAAKRMRASREQRGPSFIGQRSPASVEGTTARFEGLLPGTYRLSAFTSEGKKEMLVDVPCAPVTFAPMRSTGLEVLRGAGAGILGPAKLEPGDVITGFDGETVVDMRFLGAFAEAVNERDVTLRFERGGTQRSARIPRNPDADASSVMANFYFRTRLE